MRILLINTTEKIGGPAVAASRLMEALKNNGIKAKLLVRDKQTEQITVVELPHNLRMVWKFVWERIVIWKANHFNRNHLFAVDIANAGTDITNLPEFQQADIIHLLEAMSCGIPCVGFNVGGIPEMIDHLHNGYVAQYKSAEDFANGIYWTLTEPDYPSLSEQACRKAISHYSENVVAKKYIDLYNKVTGRHA